MNKNNQKIIDIDTFMIELNSKKEQEIHNIKEDKKKKDNNQKIQKIQNDKHHSQTSMECIRTQQKCKPKKVIVLEKESKQNQKNKTVNDQAQQEIDEQRNVRIKFKTSIPVAVQDIQLQTDENIDIKQLEIFHLMKLSGNFIISLENLMEKVGRIQQT